MKIGLQNTNHYTLKFYFTFSTLPQRYMNADKIKMKCNMSFFLCSLTYCHSDPCQTIMAFIFLTSPNNCKELKGGWSKL